MTKRLEPPELAKEREELGEIVVTIESTDEVIEIIDEVYELISGSNLNLITEEADTKKWERGGLKRWCPWCSI
jgi:hypothetical protein